MKRATFAVLTVIFAAALCRLDQKQAEIREIDRLDKIFGEIADGAVKVIYLKEDPALVRDRDLFIKLCLQEAVDRRTWDAEILAGIRCSHCKGPHIWEWCSENPRAPKLEDLR